MAVAKVCVCPQCGKKFKLREGFSAASFACTSCGATVWVEGKPTTRKSGAPEPGRGRRSGRAAKAAPRGKGAARGAGKRAAPAARGRRRGGEPAEEEQEGRRGRYERPKSSSTVLVAIAGVAVIGIAVALFLTLGKDKDQGAGNQQASQPPAATGAQTTGQAAPAQPTSSGAAPAAGANAGAPTGQTPEPPVAGATPPVAGSGDTGDEPEEDETAKPARKIGNTSKSSSKGGASKWDPPSDLGHLESTPPELRKQIDDLIALMMDPQAGRDSLDAKSKLAAIGKPAFLPILGAMARVRDTITDDDTPDERLIESSLKLADECLREMDGYLNSKDKGVLRPGIDKKYITYILKLHYRRWNEKLKDMAEMPGPYDPSKAYENEGGDEEDEGP